MTHIENIPHILEHGLCCASHEKAAPNFVPIGANTLISNRAKKQVPIERGGQLSDYIPFYFAGQTPMLYNIKNGYRGAVKRPQSEIVFVAIKFLELYEQGLKYVFTDRHAMLATANFYNSANDFQLLNWEAIETKDWNPNKYGALLKEQKQSEFLAREYISIDLVRAICAYSDIEVQKVKSWVEEKGLRITVKTDVSEKDGKRKLYF